MRPMIYQADLEELLRLRRLMDSTERKHRRLRAELISQLDAGVDIELGRLAVLDTLLMHRLLNARTLAQVVGGDEADRIIAAIEPTPRRYLKLVVANGQASRTGRRRPPAPPIRLSLQID